MNERSEQHKIKMIQIGENTFIPDFSDCPPLINPDVLKELRQAFGLPVKALEEKTKQPAKLWDWEGIE